MERVPAERLAVDLRAVERLDVARFAVVFARLAVPLARLVAVFRALVAVLFAVALAPLARRPAEGETVGEKRCQLNGT